jgi:hypothetical protein
MLGQHFVRVGLLGSVGRFAAADRQRYARGMRVVCRTPRGLEVGEVLSSADQHGDQPADGSLLRRVTVEDDLLLARLEKNRGEAYQACASRLADAGSLAVLLDVEHLFDGQSLYFYFLGQPTPELDSLTADLAAAYEAKARIAEFAETLTAGCGPHCGTEEGGGCGTTTGCSTCAVACGTRSTKQQATG